MGRLAYTMLVSLDGYVATDDGSLDWQVITEGFHSFVNEKTEAADALLYGRRTWQLMTEYWPYAESDTSVPGYIAEYSRIWKSKPKFVCSRTLSGDAWAAGVLRSTDDVRALRDRLNRVILYGGPDLAGSLAPLGLIDEYALYLQPAAIGSGKPFWPAGVGESLDLLEIHRLDGDVLYLRYGVRRP